jgi:transcriptional regulator with XRE-family HTH domain
MSNGLPRPRRTQYFSNTLLLLMERNGVNQVKLAHATGIAVSRVNNYLQGRYVTIRPDHLAAIARAVGATSAEQADLAKAYITDLLPEALNVLLRVENTAAPGRRADRGRVERTPLAPTAAAAIADLQALGASDAKARYRILWFAQIMREAHAR